MLWTVRMSSELERASPRSYIYASSGSEKGRSGREGWSTSEGKACVNSRNSSRSLPIAMSGRLRRTERMAWVAHAFWITWFAKKIFSVAAGSKDPSTA